MTLKEKLMAWQRYILINGIFGVSVWYGYVEGVQFAENVAIFGIIALTIISILVLSLVLAIRLVMNTPSFTVESAKSFVDKHKVSPIPKWIDVLYDMCILVVLSGTGHLWLAGFYLSHMIFTWLSKTWSKEISEFAKDMIESEGMAFDEDGLTRMGINDRG